MKITTSTTAQTATGTFRRDNKHRSHKLPICEATGLARYRDRHQARHGAEAATTGAAHLKADTFACPDCRGFHLDDTHVRVQIDTNSATTPADVFTSSLATRKRRYFLVDIENLTRGAKATHQEVAALWEVITQQAPGIAPHDHVVIGAARSVVRKYRTTITGPNVKWVTGANAPDGADYALLAAIDLYRVAQDFDEVVIASGDHAFADLARRAQKFGLTVHVVTAESLGLRPSLARELATSADTRALIKLDSRAQKSTNVIALHNVARHLRHLPDTGTGIAA
jgi:hypothetical protein